MVANFSGLLQVAHAVDSFNLSNDAVIGVLKGQFNFFWQKISNKCDINKEADSHLEFVYFVGTAMVLAKMPHDKISEGLKELCTPQVTPLNKVLQTYTHLK